MDSKKSHCNICNKDISTKHFDRHFKSNKHIEKENLNLIEFRKLKSWARENNILNYQSLSQQKLKEIKNNFNIEDYNLFDDEKIKQIGKKLNISNLEKLTREELINILNIIKKDPTDLTYRNDEYKDKILSKDKSSKENVIQIEEKNSKDKLFREYILSNSNDSDISDYLESLRDQIFKLIEEMKKDNNNIKGQFNLECTYKKILVDGKDYFTKKNFSFKSEPIYIVNEFITDKFNDLMSREQRFSPDSGSGWILYKCDRLVLKLTKYTALNGSSYIELPDEIKNRKACINIKNDDEYCFIYSVGCAIDLFYKKPLDHSDRVKQYKHYLSDEIFYDFEFPMKLDEITKFERKSFKNNNDYPSMSINIYELKETKGKYEILPLRISKEYEAELNIDLLYFAKEEKSHYILIKDLSRLTSKQISHHNGKKYICRRCTSTFKSNEELFIHFEMCKNFEAVKPVMPKIGETIKFKNFNNKIEHPYVIFIDFESILEKFHLNKPNPDSSYTIKTHEHIPYGFTIYLVNRTSDEFFKPICYRAKNDDELKLIPQNFIIELNKIGKFISEKYKKKVPIIINEEEEK